MHRSPPPSAPSKAPGMTNEGVGSTQLSSFTNPEVNDGTHHWYAMKLRLGYTMAEGWGAD